MTDLAPLLAPIDGPDARGPLQEYDPAFLALERAARGVPEQRLGAAVRPAIPPDWPAVEVQASALLRRTKDWRVARLLLQAWLHRDGLAGLARGLELLAGLATAFGAGVHPRDDGEWHGDGWSAAFLALAPGGEGGVLADLRALPVGDGDAPLTVGAVERAFADTAAPGAWRAAAEVMAGPGRRCLPELARCAEAIARFDQALRQFPSPLEELGHVVAVLQRSAAPPAAPPVKTSASAVGAPPLARARPGQATPTTPLPPIPDLTALTAACAGEQPCGDDLEYAPCAIALEDALRGRPDQQFGDVVIAAVPPDWPQVQALALAWLQRARDLRPAVAWTRALTRLHGVEGTAAGLRLIAALLAAHPVDLHPQHDPDDADDPAWPRRNALALLDAAEGLPDDLLTVWPDDGTANTQDTQDALAEALGALRDIRQGSADIERGGPPVGEQLAPLLHTLADRSRSQRSAPPVDEPPQPQPPPQLPGAASPSLDVIRAACAALCACLDPAEDDALCARAQRLSTLRFDDIAQGLARGGDTGAGLPGGGQR